MSELALLLRTHGVDVGELARAAGGDEQSVRRRIETTWELLGDVADWEPTAALGFAMHGLWYGASKRYGAELVATAVACQRARDECGIRIEALAHHAALNRGGLYRKFLIAFETLALLGQSGGLGGWELAGQAVTQRLAMRRAQAGRGSG